MVCRAVWCACWVLLTYVSTRHSVQQQSFPLLWPQHCQAAPRSRTATQLPACPPGCACLLGLAVELLTTTPALILAAAAAIVAVFARGACVRVQCVFVFRDASPVGHPGSAVQHEGPG